MKNTSWDKKPETETPTNPNRYRCNDGKWGCGQNFGPHEFREVSPEAYLIVCKNCEFAMGNSLGIDFTIADIARSVDRNSDFYFRGFNSTSELTERDKIRILMLAIGYKIRNPTDIEQNRAVRVKSKHPENFK